jgi:hypothetical protein
MTLTDVIAKSTRYANRVIVTDNSSSDAVRITQTGTGNALVVEDSANPDSTPFAITSTGDVGIGTTAPSQKLEVRGNINAFRNDTGGTAIILTNGETSGKTFSIISTGSINSSGVGNLEIFGGSGGNVNINTSGNFGVGTTSPAKKLHVNGTVRLQGLPTYANDAAAIAGGLVADDVYKTAAGELRIVV